MKKYIYPITIIICTLIIALTYLGVEIYKTNSTQLSENETVENTVESTNQVNELPETIVPIKTSNNDSNYRQCMEAAKQKQIAAGTAECKRLGYSDEQIANKQCIMSDQNFIISMQSQRIQDESLCK